MVEKDDASSEPVAAKQSEISEAEVDESLMESFPASDPPSWTLGTNHRIPTDEMVTGEESDKDSISNDDK